MNSRKRKSVGRDIRKRLQISDISTVQMSVPSYIHCKIFHIQNITFYPAHAAGLSDIRLNDPSSQSALILTWGFGEARVNKQEMGSYIQ